MHIRAKELDSFGHHVIVNNRSVAFAMDLRAKMALGSPS